MQKLVFVYNADSTLFASIYDYVVKVVSPKSYDCNLCKLTYGAFGMKKKWKDFIGNLPNDVQFLHRDEFEELYPDYKSKYPVVMSEVNEDLRVFITREEINKAKNLDELIELVKSKNK